MKTNKFAIYTVVTGGYDEILQPIVKDDRFDYFLFSNDFKEEVIGVWKVRHIPLIVSNDDKRLSRYPKTHPESILSEYDASLYIDANIQIADDWVYNRFIELYESKSIYAGVKLVVSKRDCIYEHALDMCVMGVEHDYAAYEQCRALMRNGFPQHFGLNENNIIYRKHTDIMREVDEEWWRWITRYSFRDQFSYMYCLWKYQIPIVYLLPEGEDARNSLHFNFISHNSSKAVYHKKYIKRGFFEFLRVNSYIYDKRYYQKWLELCRNDNPLYNLYLWGICISVKNIPNMIKDVVNKIVKKIINIGRIHKDN